MQGVVTSSNQKLVGIRLAGVTLISSLNLQSLQALGIYWESGSENIDKARAGTSRSNLGQCTH